MMRTFFTASAISATAFFNSVSVTTRIERKRVADSCSRPSEPLTQLSRLAISELSVAVLVLGEMMSASEDCRLRLISGIVVRFRSRRLPFAVDPPARRHQCFSCSPQPALSGSRHNLPACPDARFRLCAAPLNCCMPILAFHQRLMEIGIITTTSAQMNHC